MADSIYKYSFKTPRHILTSLSVYNVGYQQCRPEEHWGPGVRDHFLIHHIVSGCGKYITGGKTYEVTTHDTFLAYPDTTIEYVADNNNPFEYYWVGFNGIDAKLLLEQTDFSPQTPVISTKYSTELKDLLLQIYVNRGTRPHEQIKMTAHLYNFLAFLVEHAMQSEGSPEPSDYLQSAINYITCNYSRGITVDEIARRVGVSRSGLYRAFMRFLDTSPVQYLSDYRIRQACNLLKRTDLTIETVAYSVGYGDPLYFSRIFKKKLGISPRKYAQESKQC